MKIGRRNFIQGTSGSAAVLANFMVPVPGILSRAPFPADGLARLNPAVERERLQFRIDGWDCHEERVSHNLGAPPTASLGDAASEQQTWIRVSQSWRANWR
jgi:hypothetical protein